MKDSVFSTSNSAKRAQFQYPLKLYNHFEEKEGSKIGLQINAEKQVLNRSYIQHYK